MSSSSPSSPSGILRSCLSELDALAEDRIRDVRQARTSLSSLARALRSECASQPLPPPVQLLVLRRLCYFGNARDTEVRGATFRCARYALADAGGAEALLGERLVLCLVRSLEREARYGWEREQALRLVRALISLAPGAMPAALLRSLLAIAAISGAAESPTAATDPRLAKRWRPVEMLAAFRRVAEAVGVRRLRETERGGLRIASLRRGWGAVCRLSPAHALLPRLETGAARGAAGLCTANVLGDLDSAFSNSHPALGYEALTKEGYGPHLSRFVYTLARYGRKVAAPRMGLPRVGREARGSTAQGGPLSGPVFALTMEAPMAKVDARVRSDGAELFPAACTELRGWRTAGHRGAWEPPPRAITYVDDTGVTVHPLGASIVRAATAMGEEAAHANQRYGGTSWAVCLQGPRGTTNAAAQARGASLWEEVVGAGAAGAGVNRAAVLEAGGVSLGGASLGLSYTFSRSFEPSHRAAIAAALREVHAQGAGGLGPPRLGPRSAALMMEQRALSRLCGCFALSGRPSEFVVEAYDELERNMGAVILGCGQLTAVVGGGAKAIAARARVLSPMAHTSLARRDAGVRRAGVAAVKVQLRWYGRIWAEPALYPKALIDTIAAGCARYAQDPAEAVRQRSPTALWLAEAARVKGSPWRTPTGGWTARSILARLSSASKQDVATYWRTAAAHIRGEDAREWSWGGGRAWGRRSLHPPGCEGAGRRAPAHTALDRHRQAPRRGGGGRRGRQTRGPGHAGGPHDWAPAQLPAQVRLRRARSVGVREVRGRGRRRRAPPAAPVHRPERAAGRV